MFTFLVAVAVAESLPVERRLYAERVDASSFLWNDWNKFQENYHPNYVMDGDPATAWVEGAADNGVGQWLRVPITPMQGTTAVRLRLRNGYQKSSALYKANARAREIEVKLSPSGVTTTATLTDAEGWQELTFAQPAGELSAVELRVKSAYAGGKYTDLCISDLEVYVTAATRDNPAAEKAKMDRILAWKADRVEAAKLFAASAGQQVPLAPAYTLAVDPAGPSIQDACSSDAFCEARAAVEALALWKKGLPNLDASLAVARAAYTSTFAGWTPVQAVATDTRPLPPVEGLGAPNLYNCYYEPAIYTNGAEVSGNVELPFPAKIGFLRADTIGTFAVSNAPTLAAALDGTPAVCGAGKPTSLAWARTTPGTGGAPARITALLLVSCGEIEDREGMTRVAMPQLLVYDDAGRLQLLVGSRHATAFAWNDTSITDAWRVGRWTNAVHVRAATR